MFKGVKTVKRVMQQAMNSTRRLERQPTKFRTTRPSERNTDFLFYSEGGGYDLHADTPPGTETVLGLPS